MLAPRLTPIDPLFLLLLLFPGVFPPPSRLTLLQNIRHRLLARTDLRRHVPLLHSLPGRRVARMPPALHFGPDVLLPSIQRGALGGRDQICARIRTGDRNAHHARSRDARPREPRAPHELLPRQLFRALDGLARDARGSAGPELCGRSPD